MIQGKNDVRKASRGGRAPPKAMRQGGEDGADLVEVVPRQEKAGEFETPAGGGKGEEGGRRDVPGEGCQGIALQASTD